MKRFFLIILIMCSFSVVHAQEGRDDEWMKRDMAQDIYIRGVGHFLYYSYGDEIGIVDWYSHDNGIATLTIPETIEGKPVTVIEIDALAWRHFRTVILPPKLKKIGYYAFNDAYISEVVFNDGLRFIGAKAFEGNRIKDVHLPDTVEFIGDCAFDWTGIETLTLSTNLTEINNAVFAGNHLKTVTIPGKVRIIRERAFSQNNLTRVEMTNSVRVIESGAFTRNVITEITIGDDVQIAVDAFMEYNSAEETTFLQCYTQHNSKGGTYVRTTIENDGQNPNFSLQYYPEYYRWIRKQ